MQTTRRWRESPKYKDSSFEEYLNGKFHLPIGTFKSEKKAFLAYPGEVERWDIGVVRETINKVNHLKRPAVFKELEKKQLSKKTPITLSEIKKTIKSNTSPRHVPAKTIKRHSKPVPVKNGTDWKARYESKAAECETVKEDLRQLTKRYAKIEKQLVKAQKAVVEKNKLVDRYIQPFVNNFTGRVKAVA